MNTTQALTRKDEMIETIMKLHRCSDCSIRCRAAGKPRSIFARIHRWHMDWWPGWKIYLRELHAHNRVPTTPI